MLRASLAPLQEREFRLLFVGRLVSFLGSAVAPIALAFAVIDDLDGSASELGFVLTVGWVPQVLFILVGGVLADRLPRHLVLVGANLVSGAAQLFVAVVLLTDVGQIWHLALAQFIRGTAQSFFFPASTGLVPQTVPDRLLQQANALLRMTMNASFVAGGAAGGILVAVVGSGWALAFDGLTYFASAVILLAMRIPGTVRGATSFVHELREGWTEFKTREWLWVIVLAAAFGNMVAQGCWFVLGPIQADRELGGAAGWGVVLGVQAAGLIVGGLIALRLRPQRPLLLGQIAVTISGANLLALALGLPLAGVAAAAFLTGVTIELFGVYWDTALQQHIPRAALSRVSSYDALGSFVAIPIGLSIVGPAADLIGVETTLWIGAAVFLLAQAAALLSSDVRTLPRLDGEPALSSAPPGEEPAPALEPHAQRD